MVTRTTRDVMDLGGPGGVNRPITLGIDVDGDCGANFTIDGTTIGSTLPCDGTFVNLTTTNFTVTGTVDGSPTILGTWQATYSDLAENYLADKKYEPGTVVKIGGENEITATDRAVDPDVFGVISSNPAYVLNSGKEGLYLPVVLTGRVPVRVVGSVYKGCRLVSSNVPGVARRMYNSELSCKTPFFGRSLVDDDREEERLVEVAFVTVR